MKNRTKISMLVLMLFGVSSMGVSARADEVSSPPAQGSGPGPGDGDHHGDPKKWQKKYGLSDDQVTKLKTIMDAQKTAMKTSWDQERDLMKKLSDQVKAKAPDADIQATLDALKAGRKAMADQMEQFQSQKAAILTPTQSAQMLLDRMKHMKGDRHGHSHGKGSHGGSDANSGDAAMAPDAGAASGSGSSAAQ